MIPSYYLDENVHVSTHECSRHLCCLFSFWNVGLAFNASTQKNTDHVPGSWNNISINQSDLRDFSLQLCHVLTCNLSANRRIQHKGDVSSSLKGVYLQVSSGNNDWVH